MTINCKGQLIDLNQPKIMGILNLTPDSFFDGGAYKTDAAFLNQVAKMLAEGATFIDVGAYSSRPDAVFVSEEEELHRLLPVLDLIIKEFPEVFLSIDTFRSQVAAQAIAHGAALINDISAGHLDADMMRVIADAQVPYIMMHMRGTPQTMKDLTTYDDLLKEMIFYFSERVELAKSYQIKDLILDPGFGFSKTVAQNYEVLKNLNLFQTFGLPVLSALSRKSMIYKLLDTTPQEALNGTSVLNTLSLMKGAQLLRVHDVKEAAECIALVNQIK
ncbi:MAG: dihydropteroate synthase [Flavobacterium sp.]|nr:dihydropteroate synthase [Candidatus Neoflavobacterium equi]